MMRARIAVTLAVVLLVMTGVSATAQDEVEPEPQRVEVAEAGVALLVPAGWSVDVEMRQREDWGLVVEDEDEPLVFWNVLYASAGGRPWCDVTWYPLHPMTLGEHALLYEELMTPTHADVERPIGLTSVALPAGEAQRLVIYNEPSDDWTTVYLFDLVEGRYLLECVDDLRADDDWLGLAESVEGLSETTPRPSPDPED